MKVTELLPQPQARESFRRDRQRFLPVEAGCYVLSAFDGTILYIGLSVSLRRRMGEHLDSPDKVAATPSGRAVWMDWLLTPDTFNIERTWLNSHLVVEGELPPLNWVSSPLGL